MDSPNILYPSSVLPLLGRGLLAREVRWRPVNDSALGERCDYEIEYRVPHPDGSNCLILSRGRFVDDAGTAPDRLVGVTLDVTDARVLEKERERARELATRAEASER
jgi:hypothetical protein